MASQLQVTFGERARARRLAMKLSQAVLAERLGMKQSTISDIENGHHAPTLETVERIAEILDVSARTLVV